jgi:hypothetical protein
MSIKELKELHEIRRRNLRVYEEVEKLRRSLGDQIKIDSGKLSLIINRPNKALQPTTMLVTDRAAHAPRQA